MNTKYSTPTLSWGERFALIDAFKPADEVVCATFNVTGDELATARELLQAGTFRVSASLDTEKYTGIFNIDATALAVTPQTTATVVRQPTTATKAVKQPKKRGRKGSRIVDALAAVTETPIPVDEFIKTHGVSLAVLRQSKRFDTSGQGTVCVKKDKTTKVLSIWREPATA